MRVVLDPHSSSMCDACLSDSTLCLRMCLSGMFEAARYVILHLC